MKEGAKDTRDVGMDYKNAKKVFIFVDESGDVGDPLVTPDSSDHFVITLAVATSDGVMELDMLASGFKTYTLYKKELKHLKKKGLRAISDGLKYLTGVVLYEIVINKRQYVGPYLRNTVRFPSNRRMFRNFILKVALEYVVHSEQLQKPTEVEVVIDRYLANQSHAENLREYLIGYLPVLHYVLQVDSRYCTPIQILDIVQKVKDIEGADDNLCQSIPVPFSLQNEKGPDFPNGPGASFSSLSI